MVRALAAAAVLHGAPRLLVENNSEEEDKRTLEEVGQQKRRRAVRKTKGGGGSGGRRRAHLQTVEAGKQVVEDDDVAVDGEQSQETGERDQDEDASGRLQARTAAHGGQGGDDLNDWRTYFRVRFGCPHSPVRLLLLQAVVSGRAGRPRRQDVQEDVHLRDTTIRLHHCPQRPDPSAALLSHRHRHGNGSREAPDQRVVHGQPTEVRVAVAFRVQSHCQTWKPAEAHARPHQIRAAQLQASSQEAVFT